MSMPSRRRRPDARPAGDAAGVVDDVDAARVGARLKLKSRSFSTTIAYASQSRSPVRACCMLPILCAVARKKSYRRT